MKLIAKAESLVKRRALVSQRSWDGGMFDSRLADLDRIVSHNAIARRLAAHEGRAHALERCGDRQRFGGRYHYVVATRTKAADATGEPRVDKAFAGHVQLHRGNSRSARHADAIHL